MTLLSVTRLMVLLFMFSNKAQAAWYTHLMVPLFIAHYLRREHFTQGEFLNFYTKFLFQTYSPLLSIVSKIHFQNSISKFYTTPCIPFSHLIFHIQFLYTILIFHSYIKVLCPILIFHSYIPFLYFILIFHSYISFVYSILISHPYIPFLYRMLIFHSYISFLYHILIFHPHIPLIIFNSHTIHSHHSCTPITIIPTHKYNPHKSTLNSHMSIPTLSTPLVPPWLSQNIDIILYMSLTLMNHTFLENFRRRSLRRQTKLLPAGDNIFCAR